jgi:23S rRNA (cytosine1962-C5)-methyltransferase
MTTDRIPRLRLQKGREKRVRSGHPWVFSNELQEVTPLPPGTLVAVDGPGGEPIGLGLYNPHTLIAVRWLLRGGTELPERWLEERIERAVAARRALYPGEDCARLIFGEADGLPGIVADQYGKALVLQTNTAGMEVLRPRVESCLRFLLQPEVLVRRDDSPMRALEGLPRSVQEVPEGAAAEAPVRYLGLELSVPLLEGQKTGLFLDQRENVKRLLALLPAGASVLDLFCYQGVWGMAALKAGAASCDFVDASLSACERVDVSLKANGLPDSAVHNGDAFDVLPVLKREGRRFDAVVCDPPAFTKSKKHLNEALKAYQRLNEMAMGLVKPGGFLATSSCSHHVSREEFRELLAVAASKCHRQAQVLEFAGAAPDHPVLLSFPEGDYLKAAFLRLS